MLPKKQWLFNSFGILLIAINLLSMEAPEQTEEKKDTIKESVVTILDWDTLQGFYNTLVIFQIIIPQSSNSITGMFNLLFCYIIEREFFYNIKAQIKLLEQKNRASPFEKNLVAMLYLLTTSKMTPQELPDPLVKSFLLSIYPFVVTSNQTSSTHLSETSSLLPDYLKSLVINCKNLLDCYNQLDKLNCTICHLTKFITKKYMPDSIQKRYIEFFNKKEAPLSLSNPRIFLSLEELRRIYINAKKALPEHRDEYAKLYNTAERILNTLSEKANKASGLDRNGLLCLHALSTALFSSLSREYCSLDELEFIEREKKEEKDRLNEFLPDHLSQQLKNGSQKGKKSRAVKRSRRRKTKTNPSQESPSTPPLSTTLSNSCADIEILLNKFNQQLRQSTIGHKECIVAMYDTLVIIKKGSSTTFNIYNLSTNNCHMLPDHNPPEPLFDGRIKPWHEDKPEEYAKKLNPGATPEKITEQTWRHTFPYTCLKYFSHFGIYQYWKDKKGIDRETQLFFVEIISAINNDTLKKEGIFTVAYDIRNNHVYHAYFHEKSYYDLLNELSRNKIPESKTFFKRYYQNNFPKLPSSSLG